MALILAQKGRYGPHPSSKGRNMAHSCLKGRNMAHSCLKEGIQGGICPPGYVGGVPYPVYALPYPLGRCTLLYIPSWCTQRVYRAVCVRARMCSSDKGVEEARCPSQKPQERGEYATFSPVLIFSMEILWEFERVCPF